MGSVYLCILFELFEETKCYFIVNLLSSLRHFQELAFGHLGAPIEENVEGLKKLFHGSKVDFAMKLQKK